jgi:hypothetical protein
LPAKSGYDPTTGFPGRFYDDSGKISPFALPAPERAALKVDVPKITARGDHPTVVPAAVPEGGAEAHDLGATPASGFDVTTTGWLEATAEGESRVAGRNLGSLQ